MTIAKFELSGMELDEISLVPSGDDPFAKVVIAKADMAIDIEDEEKDKVVPSAVKRRRASVGKPPKRNVKDNMITKDDHDIVHDERTTVIIASQEHQSKETHMNDGIDKSSLTDEQIAYIEELEEYADLVDSALENGTLVKTDPDTSGDFISKADPEVAEYISKQDAKLAELTEAVAKAERREAEAEAVAKASKLSNLDTAAVAELFLALPSELVEKMEAVLTAANAVAATNTSAFAEIGKNFHAQTGGDTVAAEIKSMVEKTEGLTNEQAFAQMLDSDPSRYEALLQEGSL